ncbi:MAG: hypothetical protein D6730_08075 [Bacteroidetes bacterium]|nr:MAG: hypothetical protein D6730_08075 [Bacteroidota bacterium]
MLLSCFSLALLIFYYPKNYRDMAIKSYLVYPVPGKYRELAEQLKGIASCEVFPAENSREVLVLISETNNKEEEEELQRLFSSLDALAHISLVSAFEHA